VEVESARRVGLRLGLRDGERVGDLERERERERGDDSRSCSAVSRGGGLGARRSVGIDQYEPSSSV